MILYVVLALGLLFISQLALKFIEVGRRGQPVGTEGGILQSPEPGLPLCCESQRTLLTKLEWEFYTEYDTTSVRLKTEQAMGGKNEGRARRC